MWIGEEPTDLTVLACLKFHEVSVSRAPVAAFVPNHVDIWFVALSGPLLAQLPQLKGSKIGFANPKLKTQTKAT